MGAFIEYAIQPVRAKRRVDLDLILLLPGKIIKSEGLVQHRVQFGHGFFGDLLPGEDALHLGGHFYFSLLQTVVKGIPRKSAIGADHHHGHIQFFQKLTQLTGQWRRTSVKGIGCLRIHKHAVLFLSYRVQHIPDQHQIRHEFLGGDTADLPHQPRLTHQTVRRADDIVGLGIQKLGRDLQIDKAGVIHQHQPGTLPGRLHPHLLTTETGENQIGNGSDPHHGAEQRMGADRFFMLRAGQLLHLRPGQFFRFDFHKGVLSLS